MELNVFERDFPGFSDGYSSLPVVSPPLFTGEFWQGTILEFWWQSSATSLPQKVALDSRIIVVENVLPRSPSTASRQITSYLQTGFFFSDFSSKCWLATSYSIYISSLPYLIHLLLDLRSVFLIPKGITQY